MKKLIIFLVLIAFTAVFLPAQNRDSVTLKSDNNVKPGLAQEDFTGYSYIFTYFIAFGFVLCFIFLAAYLVRRFTPAGFGGRSFNNKAVQVISSVPVGERRLIVLLRAGKKNFLVGVTQNSINLISEIELDESELNCEPSQSPSFAKVLEKARDLISRGDK